MSARKRVECLNRNERPCNLPFGLDAMGLVLGHGFHPLKARQRRSIPNLQTVHRQGRTPHRRPILTRLNERVRAVALAASERAGVAETGRARVGS